MIKFAGVDYVGKHPNPRFFRHAMFNFRGIQTHRTLSDFEVNAIPEVGLKSKMWNKFGEAICLCTIQDRSLHYRSGDGVQKLSS